MVAHVTAGGGDRRPPAADLTRRQVLAGTGKLGLGLIVASHPLLRASVALAGGGRLTGQRFDLSISMRSETSSARLEEWRQSFQAASELLYDVTDGQHQFGTIYVCNARKVGGIFGFFQRTITYGGRTADVHIMGSDGRAYVNNPIPGLGTPGQHIFLYNDSDRPGGTSLGTRGHTIAHEFGHYGYGLYDEYKGPGANNGLVCTEGPNPTACLMENYHIHGVLTEFCVSSNHDPNHDTDQDTQNHEACWDTIARHYTVTKPSGLPAAGPTSGASQIDWRVLLPERRMVICIDRSGSMDSPSSKIVNARRGASLAVDLADSGDKIAVTAFESSASVVFPMTTVGGSTKSRARDAINGIVTAGSTAIGDGLRASLAQISGAGDRACQQIILLLSDGFQNAGEHPDSVIPDLKAAGVQVYSIAVGSDVDEGLLKRIASSTGGEYFRARSGADLPGIFASLSADTKDGGVVFSAPLAIGPGQVVESRVFVDAATERATFLISWDSTSTLTLSLRSPTGSTITPADADGGRIEYVEAPTYRFFRIEAPDSGEWVLTATGTQVAGTDAFVAQVLSESPAVAFVATTDKPEYVLPERVHLRAQLLYEVPVTGIGVRGDVIRPDGTVVPIALSDDGAPGAGDLFAGDGDFSAFFSAYTQSGTYTFDLVADNRSGSGLRVPGEIIHPTMGNGDRSVPAMTRRTQVSVVVTVPPDQVPPTVSMIQPNQDALFTRGDPIPLEASARDDSGVAAVTFSIRRASFSQGPGGIPMGYEDLPATLDPVSGNWASSFDSSNLPDGRYFVVVTATDTLGNKSTDLAYGRQVVAFIVRTGAIPRPAGRNVEPVPVPTLPSSTTTTAAPPRLPTPPPTRRTRR